MVIDRNVTVRLAFINKEMVHGFHYSLLLNKIIIKY